MTIPKKVKNDLKEHLWAEADRLDWANLSAGDKAKFYSQWTEAVDIGGKLSAYMDPRQIRVYIKDTLLKSYARERISDPGRIFRILDIDSRIERAETYIKPHGCRLSDGRVIAWSNAIDWKLTLIANFERAFADASFIPYAAVLLKASTKHADPDSRKIIEEAAKRLGLERIVFVD